ncbi:hypothetical protein AC629_38730 [Bradyrhizobium sp. NAS80.1]|uniref:hypothetical protein n=1 Tax=Bradyrhizobium sp. NAS80.1 TaxID=1680159 RepID=UPI00095CBB75|nr:hypothetical protein [Bradyrhizobium sp. NAS80.1]OKO72017.1 hypothetical protein AC629_38730 [Bradyrhizobium sp. NAS80.1]
MILDPGVAEANASTAGIAENYRLSRLASVASLCRLRFLCDRRPNANYIGEDWPAGRIAIEAIRARRRSDGSV